MNQYLFISSSYRNRLLYPNPSEFIVNIGPLSPLNNGVPNVFTTANPICYAVPDYNFCWTNFLTFSDPSRFETKIVSGTSQSPIMDVNVNEQLLGIIGSQNKTPGLSQELSKCIDILKNMILEINIDSNIYRRIIVGYDPILSQIFLNNPFPIFHFRDGPILSSILNISGYLLEGDKNQNYEDYYQPTDKNVTQIIVVNGQFPDNASSVYLQEELFLYDLSISELRTIFNITTQQVITIFEMQDSFSSNLWSPTDQYWLLSKKRPFAIAEMVCFPSSTKVSCSLLYYYVKTVQYISHGRGYYKNQKIVLRKKQQRQDDLQNGEITTTTRYIYCIDEVTADGGIVSFHLHDILLFSTTTTDHSTTTSTICSSDIVIFQPINENVFSYCEAIVQIVDFVVIIEKKEDTFFRQDTYIGQYFMASLLSPQFQYPSFDISPNFTIPTKNTENIPIDLLSSQNRVGCCGIRDSLLLSSNHIALFLQSIPNLRRFQDIPLNTLQKWQQDSILKCMIIPYSFEGVVPLNYIASTITSAQMVCHQISLISLILPNQTIRSSEGLLTSSYPFVFVELSNQTMPSGHPSALIYSNNPNSINALFICSISDVNNPDRTKFIKISSDGGNQIVKFSPYDNLKLRVSLPNGDTLTTEKTDYFVPNEADPRIQIEFLFQLTRLS